MDNVSLTQQMQALHSRIAELERDAARYQAIWRGRHDLILELDEQGSIRAVSPAMLALLDMPISDFLGRQVYEFTTPEYALKLAEESPTVFDWVARRSAFEVPVRHRDGQLLWFEGSIYAYAVEHALSSDSSGFFCVFRDVSETKVLQREHQRFSNSITDSLQVAGVETFEFDSDEGLISQSPGYSALFGRTQAQARWPSIQAWLEAIHPDDRHLITQRTKVGINDAQRMQPVVIRALLPDGSTRHIEISAHYEIAASGVIKRVVGAARDVSDIQRDRERLIAINERLNLTLGATQLEVFEFAVGESVRACSEGYGPLHGLPKGAFFSDFDQYLAHVPEPFRTSLAQRFAQAGPEFSTLPTITYPFDGDDKKRRWLESAASYQRDQQGRLTRVIGCVRDVSERELAKQREQTLLRRLEIALNAGSIETFEWDSAQDSYLLSTGFAALHGLPADKSLSFNGFLQHVHPDDQNMLQQRVANGMTTAGRLNSTVYRVLVDGKIRFVESSAEYLKDDLGNTRVIGTAVDISEKMLVQAELMRAQQRAQTAINIGELGYAEWRANQGWVEVNARYRALLGLADDGLPERLEDYVIRIHPDDREDFMRRTDEGLKFGRSKLGVHRYQRSDGTWVWIESAAHYDRDEVGELQNVLVVARDLTHQKAVEQSLESNVERLTAAMQIGQIELFEHDLSSDAYTFTSGFLELVGWTSDAPMTEADLINMVVPEDRRLFQNRLAQDHRASGADQPMRFRVDTGVGLLCLESTTKYFFDANGKAVRSLGAIRDVTYQLMVEEEIRAQSSLFEALIENAPDIIVRFDRDAKIVLANRAVKDLLGIEPLSIIGKTPEEIAFGPGRAAEFRGRIERCFESREGGRFELNFKTLPDAPPLSVRYVPELGSNGEVRFVLVMMRDVSELKKAESDAIATARQLGQILETAEEGILVADPNDMIVFNNPKLEQIFGYDPNELLGKHEALFQIDDQEPTWRKRAADRSRGLSESYTVRFKRKDGSHVLCWVNAKPLSDEFGKFSGTLAMITDASELERTEAELRQAVEWLEFSMESAQIAGFDLDLDTGRARTTTLFREWFESNSASESPLLTWMKNVHPEDHANIQNQVRQIMDRGSSSRLEFRIIDKHGALRWIYGVIVMVRNVDGRVVRMVFTVVDVSERKSLENERAQLQDQVARTQREESMGALAAGVAHDVNNLLTAAFGQIDMAKLALSDSERAESLGQIEDALAEMTALSNQMLAYSGRNTLRSRVQDLNEILEKIRSILTVSVGKQVRFAIDLFPEKLQVLADESQLQQVVINLLINAQEAVDAHAKSSYKTLDWRPAVRLDTGRLPWQQCSARIQKQLKSQRVYAFIQISDNGSGMDADTLKNAVEPFFTTKGVGRGLGLSVVEGIVRSHGGALDIRSNPGGGTQCTVYFELEQRNQIAMPGQESQTQQNGGLILVVDDESSLRSLISRTLNAQGFQTLTAGDGVQALQVLAEQPDIDLVLLDLTMPEKDGLAVFREIKQQALPVRVVLMSGYSEYAVKQLGTENYPAPAFLAKPFRANELLSAVIEALAADDPT